MTGAGLPIWGPETGSDMQDMKSTQSLESIEEWLRCGGKEYKGTYRMWLIRILDLVSGAVHNVTSDNRMCECCWATVWGLIPCQRSSLRTNSSCPVPWVASRGSMWPERLRNQRGRQAPCLTMPSRYEELRAFEYLVRIDAQGEHR